MGGGRVELFEEGVMTLEVIGKGDDGVQSIRPNTVTLESLATNSMDDE